MKTIKNIDLLKKIANGEELPALKGEIEKDFSYYIYNEIGETCGLNDLMNVLNYEVEIIEEDNKIEKLGYFDLTKDNNEYGENGEKLELHYTGVANTLDIIYDKINELIDEVNKLKEK